MAIITLSSLGHSPGTTTAAVAMALRWPRPALLLEADTSKTSAILAGRLRGQVGHRMGLTGILSAASHGELSRAHIWANSLELAPDRRLVPGFSTLGASRGASTFWPGLAPLLAALDHDEVDVLVDLGRCEARDDRSSLIAAATVALITVGASLPDVAAVTAPVDSRTSRIGEIQDLVESVGHGSRLHLVVIDRAHENYDTNEIKRAIGLPALGRIPHRTAGAVAIGQGAPLLRSRRARAEYERGIDAIVDATVREIQTHKSIFTPPIPSAQVPR